MDWNDLRYMLAVARAGSVAAAAKQLGVSHSTVYRRVKSFEEAKLLTLFERHQDGYRLTAAGHSFVERAERVEASVADVERNLRQYAGDLAGTVTIAAPEAAALGLCPQLGPLVRSHPGLTLSWQLDADTGSLLRRETDIAIVAAAEPAPTLVGRRLADIAFAIYGHRDYVREVGIDPAGGAEPPFDGARWIVFDDSLAKMPVAAWEQQHVPVDAVAMRVNRRVMLDEAVLAGHGLGVMPRLSGDPYPQLVRLSDTLPIELPLWVLTHPDLRDAPAVRAVLDAVFDILGAERGRIEASDAEQE